MIAKRVKIFFDGGCRPNPGTMETAVVVRGAAYCRHDMGIGTNSDAEWLAAIHALEVASALGERDLVLMGDSALVVRQANGLAVCRTPALAAHHASFVALAERFKTLRIRQIARTQNLAGIALARRHPR